MELYERAGNREEWAELKGAEAARPTSLPGTWSCYPCDGYLILFLCERSVAFAFPFALGNAHMYV